MIKVKSTPAQILKYRLRSQCLEGMTGKNLPEVCDKAGGIQAQVTSSAIHSLWVRNQHATKKEIENEISVKKSLVKTYGMRGTIHLLNASNYNVYINALKESRLKSSYQTLKQFGVTSKEIDKYNQFILDFLDGNPMTKQELWKLIKPKVSKKFHDWKEQIWNVFKHSMEAGIICYGEIQGNETKLVRTDQWIPNLKNMEAQEAKRSLMRIYLRAYGPASAHDFARWSGLPIREGRILLDELKGEILKIEWGESSSGYLLKSELNNFDSPLEDRIVNLLPNFDTYLMGHVDKTFYLHPGKFKAVYRSAGWISSVVLTDGKVSGTWVLEKKKDFTFLRITKFEKLEPELKDLIKIEVDKLENFLETKIKIRYS